MKSLEDWQLDQTPPVPGDVQVMSIIEQFNHKYYDTQKFREINRMRVNPGSISDPASDLAAAIAMIKVNDGKSEAVFTGVATRPGAAGPWRFGDITQDHKPPRFSS